MTNPYDDIISLPHHISASRPRMTADDRAAQFSPFAALTGYESAITEAGRLTEKRLELDEYSKPDLNERLCNLRDHIDEQPEVSIVYFQQDDKKSGGAYITATGCVKKIDENTRMLVMQDETKIPIDEISDIYGLFFSTFEQFACPT